MQNLSANELLSLEGGFHTAHEDDDSHSRRSEDAGTSARIEITSGGSREERDDGNAPRFYLYTTDSDTQGTSCSPRKSELIVRAEEANKRSIGKSRPQLWREQSLIQRARQSAGELTAAAAADDKSNNDSDDIELESEQNNNVDHVDAQLARMSTPPTSHNIAIKIDEHVDFESEQQESFELETSRRSIGNQSPFNESQAPIKSNLFRVSNILAAPVAPPPTRAGSELEIVGAQQQRPSSEVQLQVKLPERSSSLIQLNSSSDMNSTSCELLLGIRTSPQPQDAGSLSDNSYKLTKYIKPAAGSSKTGSARHQLFEERFKTWKRSNKLITSIHENPFNMHLDCLEQFSELENVDSISTKPQLNSGEKIAQPEVIKQEQEEEEENELNEYANHLSHLYKRNQEIMDSNADFRALLYNIICCLLVQDEQTLATPSVGKMLDVIRTHLDSASRVYSTTSSLLISSVKLTGCAAADATTTARRKSSSTDSWSCNSSTEPSPVPVQVSKPASRPEAPKLPVRQSAKPVDFRRISSVSYNDQQLISDLCDMNDARHLNEPKRSGSLTYDSSNNFGDRTPSSPWAYQELCDRPRATPTTRNSCGQLTQYTSQSSLEHGGGGGGGSGQATGSGARNASSTTDTQTSATDLMNDSGNGTMYEFQIGSDFGVAGLRRTIGGVREQTSGRHRAASISSAEWSGVMKLARSARRLSDFKPQQQPSYMSTDEYLSTTNNNRAANGNNRTSLAYDYGEDEMSSALQKCDFHGAGDNCQTSSDQLDDCPCDIASRRAELEWTLNKLINLELKHTWLTGQDTLRRAIRKIGVPNEIRGKVWLILIDQMIGTKYELTKILEQASKTIEDELLNRTEPPLDEETQGIMKQIELDVNRTMPENRLFDDGAEGGVKLRRILVGYSIHVNREIAYCQGFNFIVALLLSLFDGHEEKALSGFICIVDHIFPSKYYFDHYLTGARADQFLLADFICDQLIKNPTLAERKMVEGVTSSITLNWFISLFHGAVPTLTRLTILDHFMLEGVKALFRFTMAILYLAFQVTPPSSCEIFQTIRQTAKDMYDIKLLLSIVSQIKLPKDSYFAIRRSFYMVQSSFNSDQFYMQSLSSEASRSLVAHKPLSVQQLTGTKAPALSLISSSASFMTGANSSDEKQLQQHQKPPRIRTSADRTKVCVQSLGKLGRSHLRIIDTNSRSNERSLMSPLRNCLLVGISNCGKQLIFARQSSRRNFRSFREQDLQFHIHEVHKEIFDGFHLEESQLVVILTHQGEIFKIDLARCTGRGERDAPPPTQDECTETLMLRDTSQALAEHERIKLRLCTMDQLTKLLWIYVECEGSQQQQQVKSTANFARNIIIVDIVTFDLFSAFAVHPNFGEITSLRASLVAFCQLLNSSSSQFSTRIVQIGPTGRYEQLLSFCDVVDYMISVPESFKRKYLANGNGGGAQINEADKSKQQDGRYSATLKRLLTHSMSFHQNNQEQPEVATQSGGGTLTRYYKSLMRSYSTTVDSTAESTSNSPAAAELPEESKKNTNTKLIQDAALRSIVTSSFGNFSELSETNYIPVNMAFIFRNGKIALFEFTESYAIHTRESQLDRYDYSKVIDVVKNGDDFIVTILTVFDKLIKVVI